MEYGNLSFDAWANNGEKMDDTTLKAFLVESNGIEGITQRVNGRQLSAARQFLELDKVKVGHLQLFVWTFQPDAVLRDKEGLNVRVGNHVPPKGGLEITAGLRSIILSIEHKINPYFVHQDYETLHPFTDCNGRSGRMLWLWQMEKFHGGAPLGFLHTWYYQSLQHQRG